MSAPKRVLVTGAAGFVGSHTVDLLVDKGHAVTALDNLDPQVHGEGASFPRHLAGHLEHKRIRFVKGDVRDRALVESLLAGQDAVLHLAAAVGVGQSMYQPHHYSDVNIGGTAVLMDVLANDKQHTIKKVVVASSMSIYGEGQYRCAAHGVQFPVDRELSDLQARKWEHACPQCGKELQAELTPESKPLHSTSIYAITKKVQEEMLLVFGKAYGLPVVALRYFNIYGPRQSLSNPYTGVAAIFLSRLLNGHSPVIFEDGLQSRDFIHVRDIARANVLALESASTGQEVYNVGTGHPTTVLDVSKTLNQLLGIDHGETAGAEIAGKYRAGDIRHCRCDPSHAREGLGFAASISREDGFRDLVAWCKGEKPSDKFASSLAELEAHSLVK